MKPRHGYTSQQLSQDWGSGDAVGVLVVQVRFRHQEALLYASEATITLYEIITRELQKKRGKEPKMNRHFIGTVIELPVLHQACSGRTWSSGTLWRMEAQVRTAQVSSLRIHSISDLVDNPLEETIVLLFLMMLLYRGFLVDDPHTFITALDRPCSHKHVGCLLYNSSPRGSRWNSAGPERGVDRRRGKGST